MIVLVKQLSQKGVFFMSYKKLLILTFVILGLTVILGLLPIHGETEIYQNVLRLHVIANSDSEDDQALKLSVRDTVLEKTKHLFKDCRSRDAAEAILNENIALIEQVAQEAVWKAGYSYSVTVELGEEEYPTKNYESCCFPSGEYLSLRIKIGEAQGQNWWCVLFPPLCLSAASEGDDAFAAVGLTEEQYNIITQTESPKYKVRFKILESFEKAIS
jgi:stage II sporulation protein R